MKEIWKDIPGYEGRYQVSNIGRVKSFRCDSTTGWRCIVKILNPILTSEGYYAVSLLNKQFLIHRLVAKTFISNVYKKPVVDHINTVKTDNRVENMRWVTQKENLFNDISHKRRLKSVRESLKGKIGIEANRHRKVFQYSINGEFIREWGCISDACRELSIANSSNIAQCCKGKQKQSNGYIWRYDPCQVRPVSLREKAILQYDKDGVFMKKWNRITDAAKFYDTSTGRICSCLKGNTKSCKGFIWKYA